MAFSFVKASLLSLLVVGGIVSSRAQLITRYAGGGTDGLGAVTYTGPATNAVLVGAAGIATDAAGNLYLADWYENIIRLINPADAIHTIIGTRTIGFSGDGGAAISAQTSSLSFVTADGLGNIYFPDDNRIRKVDAGGIIHTIAGTGTGGYGGDGGPAVAAMVSKPQGIAADGAGNIYFCDAVNNRIRKISATGIITTIAGTGADGFGGDGGPATSAILSSPSGIALDASGNIYFSDGGSDVATGVYFADSTNKRIRKISTAGTISTIAGTGPQGYSGDGGQATDAKLGLPIGIVVDAAGNIYFADAFNNRVRRIDPSGMIATIAGNGHTGESGDGGLAMLAEVTMPFGLAAGGPGVLFVTDGWGMFTRKITPAALTIEASTADTVCTGTPVTFHVIDTLSGPYHYQWHKNGLNVGVDSTDYTTNTLLNHDIVDCVKLTATGGSATAISNAIVMTINPDAGAITGDTVICSGVPYTYTDYVTGGVWSATNGNISITPGGIATGLYAGYDTLQYSVTSSCGTVAVAYRVFVDTIFGCATAVRPVSKPVVRIYPNPVESTMFIDPGGTTNCGPLQLFVMNFMGRVVKQFPVDATGGILSADMSALSPGIYLAYVRDGAGAIVYSQKFMKN